MEPAAIPSVVVAAANGVQSSPPTAPAGQQSFAATLEDALSATQASSATKNTAESSDQHCVPLPASHEVGADKEKSSENAAPTDLATSNIAALIAAIVPPPVEPALLLVPAVTTIDEPLLLVEAAPVEPVTMEFAEPRAAVLKTETASVVSAHNPALPTTAKTESARQVSADRELEVHASDVAATSARFEPSIPKTVDAVVHKPETLFQNCDEPHSLDDETRLPAVNMPLPAQQSFPAVLSCSLPPKIEMSQGSPTNTLKSVVAPQAPDPITRNDAPTSTCIDSQGMNSNPTSLPAVNCEEVPGILITFVAAACNVPENASSANDFSNVMVRPDNLKATQDQPTPPTVDASAPATTVPLPTSAPAVVIEPSAADSVLSVAPMHEPVSNPVTHDPKLQREPGKSTPAEDTAALTRDSNVKDAPAARPNPVPLAHAPATDATSHAVPLVAAVFGTQSPADQSPLPSQTPGISPTSVQVPIAQTDHTPTANHPPSANLSPVTQEPPPTPAPLLTNVARLVDHASEAEMHIGMRTELFGGVTLHASVRDNHVGIAIGSERGDLANFLARDDSGLKDALARQSMRLDDVNFFDLGGGAAAFSDHRNRPNVDATPRLPWTSVHDATSDSSHNEAQPLMSRRGLSVLA